MPLPWEIESVIQHSQRLLNSFQHYLGRPLLPELGDEPLESHNAKSQAQQLFEAPIIIVSHGTQADPIFNYGNAKALDLWALSWADFTRLPSRQSAQAPEQPERAEMLAQAKAQGYFEGYVGDRATSHGQRFRMEDGIIWSVVDATGNNCGQAATFSRYHFL